MKSSLHRVRREIMIRATADQVWDLLGDFNGAHRWQPWIPQSEIDGGADGKQVGDMRVFRSSGRETRETLTAYDAQGKMLAYSVPDAVFAGRVAITDYLAILSVESVGAKARAVWEATFRATEVDAAHAESVLGGDIYERGLRSLREVAERESSKDARS